MTPQSTRYSFYLHGLTQRLTHISTRFAPTVFSAGTYVTKSPEARRQVSMQGSIFTSRQAKLRTFTAYPSRGSLVAHTSLMWQHHQLSMSARAYNVLILVPTDAPTVGAVRTSAIFRLAAYTCWPCTVLIHLHLDAVLTNSASCLAYTSCRATP